MGMAMRIERSWPWLALFAFACGASIAAEDAAKAATDFSVQLPATATKAPQQGRLMLLFSGDFSDEPRNQVDHTIKTQAAFGQNVKDWKPGAAVAIDAAADG